MEKEARERGERAEAREVERLILGPWVAFGTKSNIFFPRGRKPGTSHDPSSSEKRRPSTAPGGK